MNETCLHPAIDRIRQALEPIRRQIVEHRLYELIQKPEHLHVFMEHHIYAVWDFMSLLKALQNHLTCTTLPWLPKGSADTRYLINEIVLGEESDVDMQGKRCSHFELYIKAMEQSGADTGHIKAFLKSLQMNDPLEQALEKANCPLAAQRFVRHTFQVIQSQKVHVLAAVFTFGREDLIPDMFLSMVNDLNRKFPHRFDTFVYYLERHIQLDGDHHSHLALQMTSELCADDPTLWQEAKQASEAALLERLALWEAVCSQLE